MNLAPHVLELEAAQRRTHDVYAWLDESGELIDTALTFAGDSFSDQGHQARLSEKFGKTVHFGGRLTAEEVEFHLLQQGEKLNGRS